MKNLSILIYSALIIACSFFIIFMIADISNSIQFQETELFYIVLLYFAVVPIVVNWIYCILKYFKPPKRARKSKPFATPSQNNLNSDSKTPRSHFEKEDIIYYRTFLLLGIPVGLFIFFVIFSMTLSAVDKPSSNYNENKSDLRAESETTLAVLGKKLEKYIKTNPGEFQDKANPKWQSVFKSDLKCYESEHHALLTTVNFSSIAKPFDPQNLKYITPQTLFMRKPFYIYEPYEYQIISINPLHIKMRYNTKKQICKDFDPVVDRKFYYSAKNKRFYAVSNAFRKFSSTTKNSLFSIEVGNFEYDSNLNGCRFVYDNWWDNLKENHKWVFYVVDYLVMFLICFLMIFQSSRLQKIRKRRYELKFQVT